MLWTGWIIIALSFILLYRFGQYIQSPDDKRRSSAWPMLISFGLNMIIGTNLIRASQTSPANSPVAASPSDYSGVTVTFTDPQTGYKKVIPLSNAENKEYQKDPNAVLMRKIYR